MVGEIHIKVGRRPLDRSHARLRRRRAAPGRPTRMDGHASTEAKAQRRGADCEQRAGAARWRCAHRHRCAPSTSRPRVLSLVHTRAAPAARSREATVQAKQTVGGASKHVPQDGYGFTPLRTPCDPLPASIPPSLGHPPSSRRGSREPRLPRLPLIICPPPRCQVSYQVAEWWPFVGLLRLRQVSRMSTKTSTHTPDTLGPRTGPNSTNGSQLPHTRHTTQTLHYKFLRGQLQHQRNPPSTLSPLHLPLQLTLASSFAKK